MSAPDAAAAILWVGATLYAVFGGADFGAGIWDLLARGERGREARGVIVHSLTPVWEANHVWLIFCLVVLWTAFSQAFGAIMSTLFIPLCLAALGIVLRGAGFAFRTVIEGERAERAATLSFATSSLLTPFFMGTVVGAVATGRVPADGSGDLVTSWLAPAPLAIGVLFVATSAYLAAVFLSVDTGLHPLGRDRDSRPRRSVADFSTDRHETRHAGSDSGEDKLSVADFSLQTYFIRRALVAAVVAGAAAAIGLLALRDDAEYVFGRLTSEALPLVVLSGVAGLAVLGILVTAVLRMGRAAGSDPPGGDPPAVDVQAAGLGHRQRQAIRPLAVVAVVGMIWAWGVAQYPYLLPPSLTLADAAAPPATLTIIFIVFAIAAVFILPALALLYLLAQRGELGE